MLNPNSSLGPYRIVGPLGAGGMGEVYRATDVRLGRDVAIKVIPLERANSPDLLWRFEREARAVAALNHPNIVATYEAGETDGTRYLVSELLEGETLRKRLSSGKLGIRKCLDFAVQIANGLSAAHQKGIVHRDLKPENIFITNEERVKILDFGLARVLTPPPALHPSQVPTVPVTSAGAILGTVGYMAPEQVRGEEADARADIFSLGIILYEMLTGRQPFRRDSSIATLTAILSEDPPPIQGTEEISPAIESIVLRCLEKRPEARFQAARDLAFSLEALSGRQMRPGSRRMTPAWRRLFVTIPLVALVLVSIGTAIWRWRGAVPKAPTFQRVSYQRGQIEWAAFAPGGRQVVYEIVSSGFHRRVYSVLAPRPESRSLGLDEVRVFSVSSRGDLAVQLQPKLGRAEGIITGTLAVVPLAGGSPRAELENVEWADWSPDGDQLCIVHASGSEDLLEFPQGRVLYRTSGWIASPRFAPDGRTIAFIVHPTLGDDRGQIFTADLSSGIAHPWVQDRWDSIDGLAWRPDSSEAWFTAAPGGSALSIYAVSRPWSHFGFRQSPKVRLLERLPSPMMIADVSPDEIALLISTGDRRVGITLINSTGEHDLSWLDASNPKDISADGTRILFDEAGQQGYSAYVRSVDGSPPVRLADGTAASLTPDGLAAVVVSAQEPRQLVRVPLGAGAATPLTHSNQNHLWGSVLPGGKQIVFAASEPGRGLRFFASAVGGVARPISPEGYSSVARLSHDGQWLTTKDVAHRRVVLLNIREGKSLEVANTTSNDTVIGWTPDDRELYVADLTRLPHRIDVLDLATHQRQPWRSIAPTDGSILKILPPYISEDGKSLVYGYYQNPTTLYSASGFR